MPSEISILHVDDEPSLRDLTETFLERNDEQFTVETAPSADEGLKILGDRPPDCIVSDYNMPGMDGIEFLQAVREEYPDLPFILLTGKGSEEVASDAIAADVTDYLQKGTGTEQYDLLANRIRNAVQARRQTKRADEQERFTTQALDALEDIFFVIDTDGTLQRWNKAACNVTGYSDSELNGMPVIETFPEDEREKISNAVERVLTEGETTVQADLLTTDGDRLPYEFRGALLTDSDGEPTGIIGIGRNLTERRQQEQRFQALVEESRDNISVVDADGVIQYQSPAIERILGYELGEMVGDAALEYVHPGDRERLRNTFEQWVATPGATGPVEYRARHADGSWVWMEANGNNQLDNPAIEGYVVTSRDITDRKERERELERTRDLLRNVEQLADVGAWEYDPATGEPMNTAGALRIYGVDPEADLSLEEAFEFYHPEDRDRLRARFEECLETGESYEVDVRLTRADGEQRWVTAYGERTQQQDTPVVRGYIQDVTDERERINTLEQIETLFENAQDMLFIIEHSDDEFVVKRVNHAFESATGLSNEELQGKTPQELFGEAHGTQIEGRYRQCVEAGESLNYEETLAEEQVPNRDSPTDDGLTHWKTHVTPVRVDGDVDWIVGSTRDINEQKRREQSLKRRNERLDEFTSIISHDLRNPLGVVEGRLELARDDCDSKHLDDAADAVGRCQALISDLLTLAQEGERIGEIDSVGLADIAEQSWQTVATESAELNTETERHIQANSSSLKQLFENLYRNAVEHGGDNVTVHIGETDNGFYVADTGPGIPESERDDVFEAGYSTAEQGTGFGLRIVKQITDAHNWDVAVTESKQGGARFEVTGIDTVE